MCKKEIFIEKAKKIHKNKYDYSKVIYIKNRIDVEIICKEHGSFFQKPHNHLSGKGCSECSRNKKTDVDKFIKNSLMKHSGKYDYSSVEFIDSKTPVKIICDIHGEFMQKPKMHLKGSGCLKCGGSEKSNTPDFVRKSILIHGQIYDYDRVDYKNCQSKVEVICLTHGSFFVSPSNHLKGVGCSKCTNKRKLTTDEFIQKSIKINGDKYSYEKVRYVNHKTPVTITCKKHGDFDQVANYHLMGRGCKRCKESRSENQIEIYLNNRGIKYKRQFIFDDLMYKKHLKFDYAILKDDESLDFLLEFNGEQHYNFRGQFGMSKDKFDEIILRDNMKIEYCQKNKIKIIIIKHYEDLDFRLNEIFIKRTENSVGF